MMLYGHCSLGVPAAWFGNFFLDESLLCSLFIFPFLKDCGKLFMIPLSVTFIIIILNHIKSFNSFLLEVSQ